MKGAFTISEYMAIKRMNTSQLSASLGVGRDKIRKFAGDTRGTRHVILDGVLMTAGIKALPAPGHDLKTARVASIPELLEKCGGNISACARRLRINTRTVVKYRNDADLNHHVIINNVFMSSRDSRGLTKK